MSRTYRLSQEGRRLCYVLLLGVASIEAFAIWSLRSLSQDGLTPVEWVPAALMILLALAAPLLGWNILEELGSSLELSDKGLVFRSVGLALNCHWGDVVAVDAAEVKGEETDPGAAKILSRRDLLDSGTNALIGLLHRQAHGRRIIPVYGSVQDRSKLLQEIQKRVSITEAKGLEVEGANCLPIE
ncbi:MAG: hypothetical protein M1358_11405 [Chloroflexi bacterium]|nr:hypothetical protein [Chloroflexota bacterium]